MITANELKYYSSLKQKKFRESERKFLIEGKHLIEECLNSSYAMEIVLIDEKNFDGKDIISKAVENNVRIEKISAQQINKLSDTQTPQGIVGVVNFKRAKKIDFSGISLLLALDTINDPGNLGTIVRTAHWYGADYIMLSANTVDIYNSKVIRSSQGSVFHVNFGAEINLLNELKQLRAQGFKVYVLTPYSKTSLEEISLNQKSIFVLGNESAGVSEELLKAGFENLKIRGYSQCESLNAAVSAGIVLERYRSSTR